MSSDSDYRSVGRNVGRVEADEKVTGEAVYASDQYPDGLLHAAVVRSNRPHARIDNVDTSAALAMDGVHAAVERTEIIGPYDDVVRHYGDVIAGVVAEDLQTARRAANAVTYELTKLDAVFDPHEALSADAPTIHEGEEIGFQQHEAHPYDVQRDDWQNNIDDYHLVDVGDVEAGFAEADHVLEETYETPRVNHCNLDSHCCIVEWDDDGMLRINETIGSPTVSQQQAAKFMGLDEDQVVFSTPPTISSSFGGQSLPQISLEPVAATLARDTGRPVRLEFDREEEFVATECRHKTFYTIKMGLTDEGDICAVEFEVVADAGAYPNTVGHIVLSNGLARPLDIYTLENYRYEGVSVFTNNVLGGEYRAIGSTQVAFTLESHLQLMCEEAGLDPFEVRQRNFVETGWKRPGGPHGGRPIESCGVRECLERGWETFQESRQGSETDDPTKLRGWGMASTPHTTGSAQHEGFDLSEAKLILRDDGTIEARTAALEHGQGASTVIAQIVSEETTVSVEDISVYRFATDEDLDDDLGSIASRTTYIVGMAAQHAAQNLGDRLRELTAAELGVDPTAVALEDGAAVADGEGLTFEELVRAQDEEELTVIGSSESELNPPSYGVHFAEVEVDTETGDVEVLTYVAAQDVGFAINPTGVEGQLQGALLHGLEFALYSELKLDNGLPLNANLPDYPAISPFEMPHRIETEIVEANEESGPYGAKGVGTPALPPVAPSVLNAIRDATDVHFTKAPVSPEAIQDAFWEDA